MGSGERVNNEYPFYQSLLSGRNINENNLKLIRNFNVPFIVHYKNYYDHFLNDQNVFKENILNDMKKYVLNKDVESFYTENFLPQVYIESSISSSNDNLIQFKKIENTLYRVNIKTKSDYFNLILNDSYSKFWQLLPLQNKNYFIDPSNYPENIIYDHL